MKRRNTPAKNAILTLLNQAGTALSQDMIEEKVKGEMDRVTIYRVLNSFCEDGITHKVLADDGKYYFALCGILVKSTSSPTQRKDFFCCICP